MHSLRRDGFIVGQPLAMTVSQPVVMDGPTELPRNGIRPPPNVRGACVALVTLGLIALIDEMIWLVWTSLYGCTLSYAVGFWAGIVFLAVAYIGLTTAQEQSQRVVMTGAVGMIFSLCLIGISARVIVVLNSDSQLAYQYSTVKRISIFVLSGHIICGIIGFFASMAVVINVLHNVMRQMQMAQAVHQLQPIQPVAPQLV